MKLLHLTLHRCWFDLIASGEKTIEFRAINSYWSKRLVGRRYDEIIFRNGYASKAPTMRVRWMGLGIGRFQGETVFAIRLGVILATENYEGNKARVN